MSALVGVGGRRGGPAGAGRGRQGGLVGAGRGDGELVGTMALVRLIVRRDRVRLSLWIVGLVALMVVSASQVAALYDSPEKIAGYTATMDDNPALVVFAGPGYGFDQPNLGVILVNETSLWMGLGCALMSAFLVNRHTRAEEESERADLVRSTVVGRRAPITAALLVAVAANLAVALSCTALTVASGYAVAGSVALCASFGLAGVVFAAATAVAAQVASTGRGALGLGAGLIGAAFLVRGIGDIGAAALSWSSPFGWAIGVRAFAGERWWTLAGLAAMAGGCTALAFRLSARRDLGSGLLASRPGPAGASPRLQTSLGLAWRLQRASLAGWWVGVFITGLVYGSVGDQVEQMVRDNPELADYFAQQGGGSITEVYLATALRMLAMLAGGFALSSTLRARAEEGAGRADALLATAVSRTRWLGAQLLVTGAATATVMGAAGLGVGVGYAAAIGDATAVLDMVGASMLLLPAVAVLVGVAVTLFGWAPRASVAAWAALTATIIIGIFGDVLRLPAWVRDISPLEHVPAAPAVGFKPFPLLALSVVAAALIALGTLGFHRRDLTTA